MAMLRYMRLVAVLWLLLLFLRASDFDSQIRHCWTQATPGSEPTTYAFGQPTVTRGSQAQMGGRQAFLPAASSYQSRVDLQRLPQQKLQQSQLLSRLRLGFGHCLHLASSTVAPLRGATEGSGSVRGSEHCPPSRGVRHYSCASKAWPCNCTCSGGPAPCGWTFRRSPWGQDCRPTCWPRSPHDCPASRRDLSARTLLGRHRQRNGTTSAPTHPGTCRLQDGPGCQTVGWPTPRPSRGQTPCSCRGQDGGGTAAHRCPQSSHHRRTSTHHCYICGTGCTCRPQPHQKPGSGRTRAAGGPSTPASRGCGTHRSCPGWPGPPPGSTDCSCCIPVPSSICSGSCSGSGSGSSSCTCGCPGYAGRLHVSCGTWCPLRVGPGSSSQGASHRPACSLWTQPRRPNMASAREAVCLPVRPWSPWFMPPRFLLWARMLWLCFFVSPSMPPPARLCRPPTRGAPPCRNTALRRLPSSLPRPFAPPTACTSHAVILCSERGPVDSL